MTQCIALLRGINVGRAKRVAMVDLRSLIEGLGFLDVHTLLNSGNVVFQAARPSPTKVASAIEAAIQGRFGFSVPVVVLTARDLHTVVAENPLAQASDDPSKVLVAFVAKGAVLGKAKPLLEEAWAPEALAIGSKAAYLWCARGIIDSNLIKAFSRVTADAATTRNWRTVLKLQAATRVGQDATWQKHHVCGGPSDRNGE
jgi:uncharacterized protein (DUF1697 family)